MRGVTLAAAVIVVLIGAALYLRSGSEEPAPAPASNARAPQPQSAPKGMERSSRVEERLGQIREEFDRRQQGDAMAGKPEPNRRAVPTMAVARRTARPADADEDDEDPEELEELRHTLLSNPDPDERIGAVLMLTGEEGPESLRMLVEAMNDPDAEVRLAVVEALGDRAEELSPDTLTPAVRDTDPEVRFEAYSILGDMENPEALQMVRNGRSDQDEDVQALIEGILDFEDEGGGPAASMPTPNNGQPQRK